jgi:hypothetical protein
MGEASCRLVHPGKFLPSNLIHDQVASRSLELSKRAKQACHMQWDADFKDNLTNKHPSWTSLYTCCGQKKNWYSHASPPGCAHRYFCCSIFFPAFFLFFLCSRHFENNQISHAGRGYHIQIHTMFGVLEQVLEIDLLPKNVPLSDPRLQPFEGIYAKSHNL